MWDGNVPLCLRWIRVFINSIMEDFKYHGMEMGERMLTVKLSLIYALIQLLTMVCRQLHRLYHVYGQGLCYLGYFIATV